MILATTFPKCLGYMCFIPKHHTPDLIQSHVVSCWAQCWPRMSPPSRHPTNSFWLMSPGAPQSAPLGSASLRVPRLNWKPPALNIRFGHLVGLINSIPTKPWNLYTLQATKDMEELELLHQTVWPFLKKVKHTPPYDPVVPTLGIHPREMKAYAHIKSYSWMFIAALSVIAPSWRRPNAHQQVNP